MCNCKNIKPGSYANQILVILPWGKEYVGIDACILSTLHKLWNAGVKTIESCCGHNLTPGYIAVTEDSIIAMELMGYRHDHCCSCGKPRKDLFVWNH